LKYIRNIKTLLFLSYYLLYIGIYYNTINIHSSILKYLQIPSRYMKLSWHLIILEQCPSAPLFYNNILMYHMTCWMEYIQPSIFQKSQMHLHTTIYKNQLQRKRSDYNIIMWNFTFAMGSPWDYGQVDEEPSTFLCTPACRGTVSTAVSCIVLITHFYSELPATLSICIVHN
jgi:hypothetical protein